MIRYFMAKEKGKHLYKKTKIIGNNHRFGNQIVLGFQSIDQMSTWKGEASNIAMGGAIDKSGEPGARCWIGGMLVGLRCADTMFASPSTPMAEDAE